MSERSLIITGAVVGAAVGALLSHFLLTPRGRRALEELEQRFDELMHEVGRVSQVAGRMAQTANEGLRQVQSLRNLATSGAPKS